MAAGPWPAPPPRPPASLGAWLFGAAYVIVFLLLDWASYIRPLQGLNITPWNPQPALAIVLLLHRRRGLWLVWLGLLAAELIVRGWPADWPAVLAATAALGLSYAAIARALARWLDLSRPLAHSGDLLRFLVIVIVGALISGLLYVAALAAAGQGLSGSFVEAVLRYWVGDAVGSVVMLPMLLLLTDPLRRRALWQGMRSRQGAAVALLIVLLVWAVFGLGADDPFRFFYLLLLPVGWAAARLGLAGAVLAAGLTQVALIVAVQSVHNPDLTVFELQVLMAALTVTGLLLGVTVDERERAAAELKGSLRMAAAGQMSAALAHELSQPLTALGSWAQAAQLIVQAPGVSAEQRLARLNEVAQRMAADALRAGEVVKRLREFFRTGSTQLQRVPVQGLLAEALDAHQRRAAALGIELQSDFESVAAALQVNPVQIAVVLRNLIANAIDAAAGSGGPGRVTLRTRAEPGQLRLEVVYSGPGVDAARLQTLFEPGSSDKAGGMGVGLSICRAIVEAHGGRLWAEAGAPGRFCLTLPLITEASDSATHAP